MVTEALAADAGLLSLSGCRLSTASYGHVQAPRERNGTTPLAHNSGSRKRDHLEKLTDYTLAVFGGQQRMVRRNCGLATVA